MHDQRAPIAKAVPEVLAAHDKVNAFTHGIGILLSVLGLCFLIHLANGSKPAVFWSSMIYGATLISMYVASTFYHSAREQRRRRILEIADHSAIYLLIAGTFTPFGVRMGGGAGTGLLIALWCLACFGILFKIICGTRYEALSLAMYVLMGWGPVFVLKAILHATSWSAVEWLVVGGLCYTAGVPVYVLSHKIPRVHALWHIAVMIGSVCHFVSVLYCIRPDGAF